MRIGIDGNEANVKNRVGTGVYTLELLKQFQQYSSSEARSKKQSVLAGARTINFEIFLKETPLADLPLETESFTYKVFGPKKLWTQFALPIKLTIGQKPYVFFSPAHYGPRFSRVPYVVTIHDLSYLHFPELFRKEDLVQLTNWSKYSIKNSVHIIAPSQATKDDIVKSYNIDPSKITVIYEGYNKEVFKPQSAAKVLAVKNKYKITGDYIIFVGTLQPRKNIERLIEAFASIVHSSSLIVNGESSPMNGKRSTISLVVVGKKGWMFDQILTKANDLGIEDRVIFTDFVPDPDLPALISGAKVYVNPSLWEGFGIPVIEAQACGVPVIVSNISSLPEIVDSQHYSSSERSESRSLLDSSRQARTIISDAVVSGSAVLINPQSVQSISTGFKKLLVDDKLRKDLIEKGNENIKRFSWEKCANDTVTLLARFASINK